jgi:hypothetical protein
VDVIFSLDVPVVEVVIPDTIFSWVPPPPLVPYISLSNDEMLETITIGTVIGELSVVDGTGVYTFTIVSDPDNLFTIDGGDSNKTGLVDYETKTFHQVTVRADNGAGSILEQMLTIFVMNVADTTPPVIYPPGTVGEAVFGRGIFINAAATRQYAVSFDLYINEGI